MKKMYLPNKMNLVLPQVLLGASIWVLTLHPALPARAQAVYAAPYNFTTLIKKNDPELAAGTTGVTQRFDPRGLAVDAAGNIYVANTCNQTIDRITPGGALTILAGKTGCIGSTDGAGSAARFRYPQGLAVDRTGNVYVADSGNNTIRRITPAGVVTTLAGLARETGSVDGMANAARFNYPNGVAVDSAGNIYVADLYNAVIRKITPAGAVSTLAGLAGETGDRNGPAQAARFNFPVNVAVDNQGTVYVADLLNNAIRMVNPDGMVTTLAGGLKYDSGSADGTGRAAQFYHPCGLAVDSAENIYVADSGNGTIRRITQAGTVSTLAGLAGQDGNENGTGGSAHFWNPIAVAVDGAGNIYVADLGNAMIRKGFPASATPAPIFQSSNVSLSFRTP